MSIWFWIIGYVVVAMLIFAIGGALITVSEGVKAKTIPDILNTIEDSDLGPMLCAAAFLWGMWTPFAALMLIVAFPIWAVFRIVQWIVWEVQKPQENV